MELVTKQKVEALFSPVLTGKTTYTADEILLTLQTMPTVDAEPVRHGRWIKDGVGYSLYKCTACNDLCTVAGWADCIPEEQMYKAFKYCPNCGAKMDREEKENEERKVD